MSPIRYDFPNRLRGPDAGKRELARLARSMSVAYHRGDRRAFKYLQHRLARARQALGTLRARQRAADAITGAEWPAEMAVEPRSLGSEDGLGPETPV